MPALRVVRVIALGGCGAPVCVRHAYAAIRDPAGTYIPARGGWRGTQAPPTPACPGHLQLRATAGPTAHPPARYPLLARDAHSQTRLANRRGLPSKQASGAQQARRAPALAPCQALNRHAQRPIARAAKRKRGPVGRAHRAGSVACCAVARQRPRRRAAAPVAAAKSRLLLRARPSQSGRGRGAIARARLRRLTPMQ